MKQFARQWPAISRRIRQSGTLASLREQAQAHLSTPLAIPATGIASWNLYYFCPQHGVRLTWDRHAAHQHRCPVDGHLFSGEPYDSAWWREMNGRNASACQQLGLLWQLTGETQYARRVRDLLCGYADVYPGYAVHGNIPHNGPGKMNAQTLCEANCLLEMALGYDFIADWLSAEEQQHIGNNLLRCGAAFLRAHRNPQIHNHEVKINAALAVLGIVLDDETLLDVAVNQPYGLRWQLENGLLDDGLWFEGSLHYHYYALQGFFAFEKLARDTRWSLLDGPWYRNMLHFPLQLLLPDVTFPRLNDCLAGQEALQHSDLYEFAWQVWADPLYASVLRHLDPDGSGLEAQLWRTSPLPEKTPPLVPAESVTAVSAGLTLWRRPDSPQKILFKHSPYGGEHDHYDRLSLNIWQDDGWLLPDLGTTGYGAGMHYGYYKNSATHNTLTVNQSNQPPAVPVLLSHEQGKEYHWIDARVDWRLPPPPLNSHTRVEWDVDAWRDVVFRRQLLWWQDLLIDVSLIDNPHRQQLDWTLHLAAQALDQSGTPAPFALSGPLREMHHASYTPLHGCQPRHFRRGERTTALWLSGEAELWQGRAPDNPAVSDLSYLVLRTHQANARLVCVWDFASQTPLTDVTVTTDAEGCHLQLHRGVRRYALTLPFADGALPGIDD